MPYTAHPTAVIDEGCTIGEGTRIWHSAHHAGLRDRRGLQHRAERGGEPWR